MCTAARTRTQYCIMCYYYFYYRFATIIAVGGGGAYTYIIILYAHLYGRTTMPPPSTNAIRIMYIKYYIYTTAAREHTQSDTSRKCSFFFFFFSNQFNRHFFTLFDFIWYLFYTPRWTVPLFNLSESFFFFFHNSSLKMVLKGLRIGKIIIQLYGTRRRLGALIKLAISTFFYSTFAIPSLRRVYTYVHYTRTLR